VDTGRRGERRGEVGTVGVAAPVECLPGISGDEHLEGRGGCRDLVAAAGVEDARVDSQPEAVGHGSVFAATAPPLDPIDLGRACKLEVVERLRAVGGDRNEGAEPAGVLGPEDRICARFAGETGSGDQQDENRQPAE
jgi:hypothetical protein